MISFVLSMEPSSMMMNSKSVNVWLRMLAIASRKYLSPLYTAIMTETLGFIDFLFRQSRAKEPAPAESRCGSRRQQRSALTRQNQLAKRASAMDYRVACFLDLRLAGVS